MSQDNPPLPSTRPYLIRALHEWCSDNGFTPYLVVAVDSRVRVPQEFVQDGQIVLNTSYEATSHLQLGNDTIEFKARFGGVPRDVWVPIDHVLAIYARENGSGMAFDPPEPEPEDQAAPAGSVSGLKLVPSSVPEPEGAAPSEGSGPPPSGPKPSKPRQPVLKRVK
ncbi:stringent starvation protein B [Serpentinimonas maccroryi]|jgi:stringent starvation protein B|uniref:Stringent starvation protein B n=1 Tax=Serpentinimonas maccroryi TaxID=1458426 RepID=A0A060NQW1_9BURK|nr:ClpXP protease specificity-enhancing factor [Serpentinimonas maccroryi]MCM2479971.1 ClpXP protease specificity-enhancing factor [Serpentinimonas maccroryi]OYX59574.1 MAG: stringent starvation protein B [Comamonadaceae bacterium 32-67-11]OZA91223.1 MAG: stringent starvation protein B [Burkholderiales bacterium 34-67-9]BAO83755.1 stringent starvation protein B [Serpentinimonas maccroryi]